MMDSEPFPAPSSSSGQATLGEYSIKSQLRVILANTDTGSWLWLASTFSPLWLWVTWKLESQSLGSWARLLAINITFDWWQLGQRRLLAGLQVLGHNSECSPLPLIHNHYGEDSSNAEILSKYSELFRNIDYQRSFCAFCIGQESYQKFCFWEVAWCTPDLSLSPAKKSISVTIYLTGKSWDLFYYECVTQTIFILLIYSHFLLKLQTK